MKMIHAILIGFLTVNVALAAAPSVTEVESTISSGDYTKARKQLAEVLKENPESIVANKYMLEIIRIENARDNITSVEYKLYEDRIRQLDLKRVERIEAEAKAKAEKESAEFWASFRKVLGIILSLIFAVLGVGFGWIQFQKRREAQRALKLERRAVAKVEADLLDIGNTLEKLLEQGTIRQDLERTIKLFIEDNDDCIGAIQRQDYNLAKIQKHVNDAKYYILNEFNKVI